MKKEGLNVRLSEDTHARVKKEADREGKKIYVLTEELIRLGLKYKKILTSELHTEKEIED